MSRASSTPPSPLTAAMLYARAQGHECTGMFKCHWCGSPCSNHICHDDPPPVPFQRSNSTAKFPSEPYVCVGCQCWRWPKMTVVFMDGEYKDGQTAKNHSWFITPGNAWAIKLGKDGQACCEKLYEILIDPPLRFALALRGDEYKVDTLIQLAIANDPGGILADTPLAFTIDNIPHSYTIYELTEAIRNGPSYYGPGVRALWRLLGEPPAQLKEKFPGRTDRDEKKGRGRPATKQAAKDTAHKVVVASGLGEGGGVELLAS